MKILVTDGFILWNFIFVRISITFGRLIGRFYPQTIKRIKSIFIVERTYLFSPLSNSSRSETNSNPNRKETESNLIKFRSRCQYRMNCNFPIFFPRQKA